jgi:hypothetical protein
VLLSSRSVNGEQAATGTQSNELCYNLLHVGFSSNGALLGLPCAGLTCYTSPFCLALHMLVCHATTMWHAIADQMLSTLASVLFPYRPPCAVLRTRLTPPLLPRRSRRRSRRWTSSQR